MNQKWYFFIPAIVLSVIGLSLILYGLKDVIFPRSPEIEIIKAEESPSPSPIPSRTIVVDISGAVEKPGVYTLPYGSRINDCLVAAGGLSANADKNYLSRYVNLASVVPDGAKIYILKKGESPIVAASPSLSPSNTTNPATSPAKTLLNINSDSQSELESLPGIGPVRAKNIIEHRPYASLEELKTKANIPDNVYQQIKDLITL